MWAQCKTGRLVGGAVVFSTQSTRVNTRATFRRDYIGDVDFFAIWCPSTRGAYLVPIEDCAAGAGRLRIAPTRNGQARRVRWAKDYELPPVAA